jgi:hypothetical protein
MSLVPTLGSQLMLPWKQTPPPKKKKKKKPSNTISDVCKLSATSSFVIINEWLLSNPNYFGISRRYIFVSVHVRRHAGSIKDS